MLSKRKRHVIRRTPLPDRCHQQLRRPASQLCASALAHDRDSMPLWNSPSVTKVMAIVLPIGCRAWG